MITIDSKHTLVSNTLRKVSVEEPLFAQYEPDIKAIEKQAKKYKGVKNIIVIGNGGSITSFNYYYHALGSKKKIFIISTMEPSVLKETKKACKKDETVVITVSKSGNTVGVIEAFLYFLDYQKHIIITEKKESALKNIQETLKLDFFEHPPVGGRYSGFTPSGLLPAAIAGIDIAKLWSGAQKAYKASHPKRVKNNEALCLASIFIELSGKKYSEIFMPIYAQKLLASADIITQLIHESTGKKGKGQTLLASFAPESQHHTNQRFFGGKNNMLGCFVKFKRSAEEYEQIKVPKNLQNIPLRDGTLKDIHENYYAKAHEYEYEGTRSDAILRKKPHVVLSLKDCDEECVGYYLAFWHYVTMYMCELQQVNPFDQPEVENSKKISFELRKKTKGKKK